MRANKDLPEESIITGKDDSKSIDNKLNNINKSKLRKFKYILFPVIAFIIPTLLFFIFSLFLNEVGNKLAEKVIIFTFLNLFIYGISWIITGKSRVSFIKGRLSALTFLIMLINLGLNFLYINMTNSFLAKDYGSDVFAKLKVYSKIYNQNKESIKQSKELSSYNASFLSITHKNITIYYNSELEPALPLIEAYLDDAISENNKIFPNVAVSPMSIRFDYDKEIFDKRNPNFKNMDGLYIDDEETAYIYINDCYKGALALGNKSANLKNTILHEYAHHFYLDFMKQNKLPWEDIPAWFYEGVASYMGEEGGWKDPPKLMVDLDKLETEKQWENYSNETNVYAEGYYAVDELILLKGKNIIKDILLKTKSEDFTTAFNDVVGFSVKDYEKSLQADANNDWKKYFKMATPFPSPDLHWNLRIKSLENYIKSKPDNINALLDLGDLYENKGELDKAKKAINTALKKEPGNSLAKHRLSLIEKEIADKQLSKDKAVDIAYNSLIKKYKSEVINKDTPKIEESEYSYKITFAAKSDAILGPIIVTVDKKTLKADTSLRD